MWFEMIEHFMLRCCWSKIQKLLSFSFPLDFSVLFFVFFFSYIFHLDFSFSLSFSRSCLCSSSLWLGLTFIYTSRPLVLFRSFTSYLIFTVLGFVSPVLFVTCSFPLCWLLQAAFFLLSFIASEPHSFFLWEGGKRMGAPKPVPLSFFLTRIFICF